MLRTYLLAFTCLVSAACDDELDAPDVPADAAAVTTATVRDAAADAVNSTPPRASPDAAQSDGASAQPSELADAHVAETHLADADVVTTDASVEPPNPLASGLDTSGQVCYPSSDDLPGCAPSECLPASFSHVNDGSLPYTLECSGPCGGQPWPVMNTPDVDVALTYQYHWGTNPSFIVGVGFTRAFYGATTTQQAIAASDGSSLYFGQKFGTDAAPVDATTFGPAEIVSFDGRHLRLRGHAEIPSLTGSSVSDLHPCVSGNDHAIPGELCTQSTCGYSATAHASVPPATVDVDVTFELN